MFKPLLRAGAALGRRQPFASLGAATGRFLRCTSGISSVEFVIVLPPFLMLCFGIIGFSLVSFAHNNMVNAAREATRRLSVAEGTVTAQNAAPVACGSGALDALVTAANPLTAAEEMACDYLTGWAITFNVNASECLTPADRDVTVRITTLASDAFMVDFLEFFQGDLVAEVTMRREAECPPAP